MTETKFLNYLFATLMILTTIMFVWTVNIISSTHQTNTYTTVSAFNG